MTRPGGIVAILEHNPLNPLTRVVVSRCEFDEGVELVGMRDTKRLLEGAGTDVVESSYFLFFPWHARVLRRVRGGARVGPPGSAVRGCGQTLVSGAPCEVSAIVLCDDVLCQAHVDDVIEACAHALEARPEPWNGPTRSPGPA